MSICWDRSNRYNSHCLCVHWLSLMPCCVKTQRDRGERNRYDEKMMKGKMRKEGRSIDGERLRLRRLLWVTHSCYSASDVYDFSFSLPVHQQDTSVTLTWELSWGYQGSVSSCSSTSKCVDAAVQIILLPFGWVWKSQQVIKIWMNINSLDRIFCPAVLLKLL